MLRRLVKQILLIAASTMISALMFVGAYEAYKSYAYDQWKSEYETSGDWYGHSTIPSPNEILMWEYRPNGEFLNTATNSVIRTNKYGFRQGKQTTLKKREGDLRIAIAGDSVTLGIGVDHELNFVFELEKYGNKVRKSSNLEALNFGIDGYSTVQILETIKTKVLQFSPDTVIYIMCLNDFDFLEGASTKIKYFKKPDIFILRDLKKVYKHLAYGNQDFHRYYFEKNKEIVFDSVTETSVLLANQGIGFYVAVVPVFMGSRMNYFSRRSAHEIPSFDDYPLTDIHDEIVRFLTQQNMQVVDLLDNFREKNKSPEFYALDI